MSFLIDQIDSSGLFAQSAYSASIATKDSNGNDITATYLTGVDLTPYQTTAGMTGYATTGDVSGAEWNSCYETVYSNSGSWTGGGGSFTGVTTDTTLTGNGLSTNPLGVANVQSLTSDESINITLTGDNVVLGVADTWFNNAVNSAVTGTQGDAEVNAAVHNNSATWNTVTNKLDTTAFSTVSGKWNSNYETVNTNSGVWGGSALNISAGEGVKVTLVNNNLVFSTDETVLWSGNATSAVNLSEDLNNFERIKIEYGPDSPEWHEYKAGNSTKIHEMIKAGGTSATYWIGNVNLLFSGTNIRVMTAYCWDFKNAMSYNTAYNTYALNTIRQVIGINRKNNA